MPRLWDRFAYGGDALTEAGTAEVPHPGDLGDLFFSSIEAQRAINAPSVSRAAMFASPYVQERGKLLEQATGVPAAEWDSDTYAGPWADDGFASPARRRSRLLNHIRAGQITLGQDGAPAAQGEEATSALEGNEAVARRLVLLERARARDPRILSDEGIGALMAEDIGQIQRRQAGLSAASPGVLAGGAEFAGSMIGGTINVMDELSDLGPLALPALLYGGAARGATSLERIARVAGREAALGAATEIPLQEQALRFNRSIGVPYTMKEAAANVLFATLGSAVLGGTFQGGAEALRGIRGRVADLKGIDDGIAIDLADMYGANPRLRTPQADQAAAILRDAAETSRAAPVPLEPAQQRAHAAIATKAREDLEAGDVPAIERQVAALRATMPELEGLDRDLPFKRRLTPDDLEAFDPAGMEVDAQLFQFKAGGDEFGVTERLRDVGQFEPAQAGTVLVWERKDGKLFIVDGHQRMGIARRALAGGQDPAGVFLSGYRLREADGATPQHARVLAAFKNIGEGTGSAVDVAKIYREAHRDLVAAMPQLSANNALARDGRNLSKLGDEAFGMAVNDVVRPEYAAVVGEILPDSAEQVAAIDVLRRAEPANTGEARAIVEQVRAAGFTRAAERSQGGLFSDADFAASLFKERAQILQGAKAEVRRDLSTFRTLGKQKGRISQAGNKLADKQNLAKVAEDEQTLTEIDRLANVGGPVADALNAAARRLGAGEVSRPDAVAAFVGDLRTAAASAGGAGTRARARQPGAKGEPKLTNRGTEEKPSWVDADGITRAAPGSMTPVDRAIENRMAAIVKDVDAAEAAYAKLEDSKGGKVMSADTARELSPDYLKNRTKSAAVHEPASWLMKQLYARALARAPKADEIPMALFTAGGTGAGKTTAIGAIPKMKSLADRAQVIYDANMNTVASARSKIDAALKAGKVVRIALVVREPVDALVNGALKRAMRQEGEFGSGRTVPYFDHIDTHVGAIDTFHELRKLYADNELVQFVGIDNTHGAGKAVEFSALDDIKPISYNQVAPAVREALEQQHDAGKISDAVYEGFLSRDDPRTAGDAGRVRPGDRQGADGQPEPGRGGSGEPGQGRGTGLEAEAAPTVTVGGEKYVREADLLGDDTAGAQALADEAAARDAARNAGQVDLETGDPSDLFSAARNQAELFQGPTAVRALERAQEIVLEDPDRLFTILDETGAERRVSAAEAFADLDAEESALRRVALCATPGEA